MVADTFKGLTQTKAMLHLKGQFKASYTMQANGELYCVGIVCDINKPKQTNADRIRAMTDEELAVFLRTVECDADQFPFIQDWDKWLQQPAEGD